MSDFAQVKYLTDGIRASVPTSYFKAVMNDLLPPGELEIDSVYKVFWSPEEEETPSDVLESSNEIIDVDELSELQKKQLRKNGPIKGFYNALLLSLSQSEVIERGEIKRELSGSNCLPKDCKRTRAPSLIALEAKASTAHPNSKKDKSIMEPGKGSKADKATKSEASKRNLNKLFDQCENPKRKKNREENSHNNDAEYWKNKFLESLKNNEKEMKKDHSKEKQDRQSKKEEKRGELRSRQIDTPSTSHQTDMDDDLFGSRTHDDDDAYSKSKEELDDSDQIQGDSDSDPDSTKCSDDEIEIPVKKKNVPSGQVGDSMALFNYAEDLWGNKLLVQRSPSGLPAASKNKKVGYPRMTPLKTKKCEEFLKNRVLEENPQASQEEIRLRVSKTKYILGQKVASVRKCFRRQGIPIPTAEEAHEVRKKLKKEKKKAKKRSGLEED